MCRRRVEYLPMFKVTVIMLRDIVESVILENDEAWNENEEQILTP